MAQNESDKVYEIAYNYLKELPEFKSNCILVADTIIQLDLSNFMKEISADKGLNERSLLFRLDSIDNNRDVKNHHLPSSLSFHDTKNCGLTLFFSEIYKNTLLAEIIENRGEINANHNHLTAFNTSKIYLFEFDGEMNIVKVYSKKLQYD